MLIILIFSENYLNTGVIWNLSARAFSPLSLGFHSEFGACDSIVAAREYYSYRT